MYILAPSNNQLINFLNRLDHPILLFLCSKFIIKRTEKDPQIQFLHFSIKTYMHQASIELLRERDLI